MVYHSAINKVKILLLVVTYVDLENIKLSKNVRQTNTIWYHLYTKLKNANKYICKTNRLTDIEN